MHVTLRHPVDGHLLAVDRAGDQPGRGRMDFPYRYHTPSLETSWGTPNEAEGGLNFPHTKDNPGTDPG